MNLEDFVSKRHRPDKPPCIRELGMRAVDRDNGGWSVKAYWAMDIAFVSAMLAAHPDTETLLP